MKKIVCYISILILVTVSMFFIVNNYISSKDIVESIILSSILIFFVIMIVSVMKVKFTIYIPITILLISLFIGYHMISSAPSDKNIETLKDFSNTNITEVINWGSKNKIKIIQTYEFSDTVEKNMIIRQSIKEGTTLKSIKEIEVIISNGPNYDQSLIVPTMLGWDIDRLSKFIKENLLIKVNVEYIFSKETKDTVIDQNRSGEMRRNEDISITLSLGNIDELGNTKMIDLKNITLFDATLFLKRNGIKYELKYEHNEIIKRNYIINQDKDVDYELNPKNDTVMLTVSKGKEIIVPDLIKMSIEDITKWVVANNLKITFESRYDENVKLGSIIEVNKKQGDVIEEGTYILIVSSKGQLRMGKFNSLSEFKEWAHKYGINYRENYEYNDSVGKGNVVSYSLKEDAVINNNENITVTISLGKPVYISNFVGKTKSEAQKICNNSGINCIFVNGKYTTYNKNVVYSQSKGANTQVTIGSSITLTLSLGPPKTMKLYIMTNWLVLGNADSTIASLKDKFRENFSGVNFNFVTKVKDGWNDGMIHSDSPTKDGAIITQGSTYTIWIVKN